MAPTDNAAIARINQLGALLVFPADNRPEPRSLWSEFHPRAEMRWEWSGGGDSRVWRMWAMMKRLSSGHDVVYSKWYAGRATFFSQELFTALLAESIRDRRDPADGIDPHARQILEILDSNSPLSTRQLKLEAGLAGRENEGLYGRSVKALFTRFLIIAPGEVDEGSFPSLALGSTRLLREDLWAAAERMSATRAQKTIDRFMPPSSRFRRFLERCRRDP
ncbi:MAG TPA: hypothetical protein VFY29_11770 [Terriglobia bacterium]|nr:hypothetical protein [Terriglobia bacterium]